MRVKSQVEVLAFGANMFGGLIAVGLQSIKNFGNAQTHKLQKRVPQPEISPSITFFLLYIRNHLYIHHHLLIKQISKEILMTLLGN